LGGERTSCVLGSASDVAAEPTDLTGPFTPIVDLRTDSDRARHSENGGPAFEA